MTEVFEMLFWLGVVFCVPAAGVACAFVVQRAARCEAGERPVGWVFRASLTALMFCTLLLGGCAVLLGYVTIWSVRFATRPQDCPVAETTMPAEEGAQRTAKLGPHDETQHEIAHVVLVRVPGGKAQQNAALAMLSLEYRDGQGTPLGSGKTMPEAVGPEWPLDGDVVRADYTVIPPEADSVEVTIERAEQALRGKTLHIEFLQRSWPSFGPPLIPMAVLFIILAGITLVFLRGVFAGFRRLKRGRLEPAEEGEG